MNKNPIFIEYYSHENCDCYKVLNPWTTYAEEKFVLCKVSEGIDLAKKLCELKLFKEMLSALEQPIKEADRESV